MTPTRHSMQSTKFLTAVASGAVVTLLSAGAFLQPAAASMPTVGNATSRTATSVLVTKLSDTTIALRSSNPNAHYGDAGNITATVKAVTHAAGVPTGSVEFFVDGSSFWTATVDALGRAKLPLAEVYPSFYPGTYAISATYTGDANHNPSTTLTALSQTLIGISKAPTATVTLNPNGLPVFNPRSFTLSSVNPVGCNVSIVNNTPGTVVLAYGTPGSWKVLPNGAIASGGTLGVGVGISHFTGYFTTTANTRNYIAIHCK